MAKMNRVCVIGNLCKMPNLRVIPSGKDICDLLIAVNRKSSATDFLPVIVWGKDAVACNDMLKTGSLVAITGKLQSRNYEKADGSRHVAIEVVAEEIEFLDKLLKGFSSSEVEEALKDTALTDEDIKAVLEVLKKAKEADKEEEVKSEEVKPQEVKPEESAE